MDKDGLHYTTQECALWPGKPVTWLKLFQNSTAAATGNPGCRHHNATTGKVHGSGKTTGLRRRMQTPPPPRSNKKTAAAHATSSYDLAASRSTARTSSMGTDSNFPIKHPRRPKCYVSHCRELLGPVRRHHLSSLTTCPVPPGANCSMHSTGSTSSLPSASRERYHSLVSVQGRLHSCRQCTFVTKYSANMKRHIGTHTGERPFQCYLCPAVFSRKLDLSSHIRTHTGERPYLCDCCSASFSRERYLVNHKRIHTGERPFSCDHCNKSFSQKANLFKHMRTHSGERPYSCDHCSASFSRNRRLMEHVARCHETNRPHNPPTNARRGTRASRSIFIKAISRFATFK
ncbi:hypothetical protein HPB51_000431 [Rhipicephalus microplus]|uniref:C2H2-type domain-containing protein n=1 Tax=Rhipicephalus microplus TaxID=6941 RepID=A0A9J6E5W1_RHIMP|nr:hypothetical protein HPB51_000431 [Rhipicephalus microplus]